METLFIISAYAMPLVMLAIVWLITGHFAWSALAAVVFFFVIKLSQKKLGYGKTILMEIVVVIAIFAGDQARVEQVALGDAAFDDPALLGKLQQLRQDLLQLPLLRGPLGAGIGVQAQGGEQIVFRPDAVGLLDQAMAQGVVHACGNALVDHVSVLVLFLK